jgi:putative ABC transport system permease protein
MIKHYLKTLFRNSRRNKLSTFINVLSIAVGLSVSLMILLYVMSENNYDSFHQNGDRIYRLRMDRYSNGKLIYQLACTPCPMGPGLKKDFPGIQDFARLRHGFNDILRCGDLVFKVPKGYSADASFMRIFSFNMVKGDRETALAEPRSAILSQSFARKFFGDEDPVGKTLVSEVTRASYKVTGIFEDLPENSHIKFDMLKSIHRITNDPGWKNNWDDPLFILYVLLDPHAKPLEIEKKLPDFLNSYAKMEPNSHVDYFLQPLRDIYLNSEGFMWEIDKRGNLQTLYFFTLIALFILLIAWVNYINLSTAKSVERAKETGLRKVVGALRKQLIGQFLLESFVLNCVGVLVALALVALVLPYVNQSFGLSLSLALLLQSGYWILAAAVFLAGTILSGLYPAFVLSSFRPATVIMGASKYGSQTAGGAILRKALVVFQFVACLLLVSGTVTVYKQISFMKNQDLGISIDNILLVSEPMFLSNQYTNFRQKGKVFADELLKHPGILAGTLSNYPGQEYQSTWTIRRQGSKESHKVKGSWIDYNFFDTYQVQLLAGRNFSPNETSDRKAVIVNEEAMKLLGFDNPQDAVGQQLVAPGKMRIVAVAKNYHQIYLKEQISPVCFRIPDHGRMLYFSFKVDPGRIDEIIPYIKSKYSELFPGSPFDYKFLDEYYDRQYVAERQFGWLFGIFSLFAIFVACLGLYGLTTHLTLQRRQEIGIRKVMGATVSNVMGLFFRDSLKLILLATLLALPVGYYLFSDWLANYAYRLDIGWWFALYPLLVVLPIVFLTIVYHVLKVSLTNPAETLRYE